MNALFPDSSDDDLYGMNKAVHKAVHKKAKKAAPRPKTTAAVPKPVSESNEARREADRLLRRREVLGPSKTLLPGRLRWKTQAQKQNDDADDDDDQLSDMTSDQLLPFLDLLTSMTSLPTEAAAVGDKPENRTEETTASADKAITTSSPPASSAAGNEAVSSVLRGHSRRGTADSILSSSSSLPHREHHRSSSYAAQSPPPKKQPSSKRVLNLGVRVTKK